MNAWGVRKVFGYPGDGINGVFGALNRARDKIASVQARHKEMAAFMASAYAKFSGELGRMHRDLRPRRLSSDYRALRRPARPPAGASDCGPAIARCDWRANTSRKWIW